MSDANHLVNEEPPALEGSTVELHADDQRADVLEKAFDYRGDVTLTLTGGEVVEGYLFDRRDRDGGREARVLTPAGERVVVAYADVAKLGFSGRDPAAGRSWETWVKKYVEKKKAGLSASMEPEKLD